MALTEQQKEIALRVAGVDPELRIGVCWSQKQIIDFAARFLAALPEPVAYADAFGNVITKATKEFSRNVLTNEFNRPLYATPPANKQSPIAWATTNEDGDYAMLFFDKQEARSYSGDDEPVGLAPVSLGESEPDYKAPPASEQKPAVPDVLFDGYSVLSALAEHQRARTSPENVSDVLDAVVRLIRTSGSAPQPDYKAQRDGLLDALRTCDDGLALLDQDKFGAMRLMIGRAIAAAKGEK